MNRLPVFFDADVLFAGAATPRDDSASQVVLAMAQLTLIDGMTCNQTVIEAERNLLEKVPAAVPLLHAIIGRNLRVVSDPTPDELLPYAGQADPKDLPILVAAITHGCRYLLTFNVCHFAPRSADIVVLRPGDFLVRMRALMHP